MNYCTSGENREVTTETIELPPGSGTWFAIDWFGPTTTPQKDAIRTGITHGIEAFLVSNASNPCKMSIQASGLLGTSVLAITTTDWILANFGNGNVWYPAFLVENLPEGSNSNGTDYDITIEWNRLITWDLSTTGGTAGTDPNLMYVIMHEFGGHGMGFQSSANYDSQFGLYSLGWSGFPNIFDLSLRDGAGNVVWNNPNYSSSTELGALFTSDDVWFELDTPTGKMVAIVCSDHMVRTGYFSS